MKGDVDMDYIDYAKKVLPLYPISYSEIKFIRHNENMIFQIIDNALNKSYVLRIHKSNIEGFAVIQHSYECLRSEMEFLFYLSNNSSLTIQKPIYACNGEFVATSYEEDRPQPLYSTLLEWIEGSTLTLKEDNLDDIIYSLGVNVAIFHEASMQFQPSNNFLRPVYSTQNLKSAMEDLKFGIDVDLYNINQYKLMTQVADKVISKLELLDERSDAWGLIHTDYQLGNVIVSNEKLSFIDFCLSGYGYYLFDLGSAATMFDSEKRNIFLDGYASRLPFSYDDLPYIDCLIFTDIFVSYNLFIKDANKRGWIKDHTEKLCNDVFLRFLDGETVFYSL